MNAGCMNEDPVTMYGRWSLTYGEIEIESTKEYIRMLTNCCRNAT